MSIVGDNIRALRELKGITQQELAAAVHVSRETVNKWENGTIESVRERNLALLREHYGLSMDDLRSEYKGLAAQLHAHMDAGSTSVHPQVEGAAPAEASLAAVPYVSDILWREHPGAYAIEMDSSMSRVLPAGCLAFVDPQIQPTNGAIVLAKVMLGDKAELAVRRLHLGSTKALLSAESYEADQEDIVVDVEQLDIRGTVFWYQAPGELV